MARLKYNTLPTPRTLLEQFSRSAYNALRNYLRMRWKQLLLRSGLALPVLLIAWLFVTVDVRFNDRQTIAKRALALGGLGLTPYFVYTHTPPLYTQADRAALRHGIDPLLFRALIQQESQWDAAAVSPVGAVGLSQLMPATALGECNLTPEERFDVDKNLNCGAHYFAKQLRRFGSVDLALAAYNSGPERVAKLGRVPRIRETQNYVSKIMAHWGQGV